MEDWMKEIFGDISPKDRISFRWTDYGPYNQFDYAEILMKDAQQFVNEMQDFGLTREQAIQPAIRLYKKHIFYQQEEETA